jgi:hypothetical protein
MRGDLIKQDPSSEAAFEALVARIDSKLAARLALGGSLDTPDGIRTIVVLVADTLLDGFVVQERTDANPRCERGKRP